MLMLGGPVTYSGTPQPGPQQSSPWGWLGGLGGGKSHDRHLFDYA